MEFCPVCKRLLQIKKENNKNIGFCECGFKRMSGYELSASEESKILTVGEGIIEENKENKSDIKKLSYEDKKERKAEF